MAQTRMFTLIALVMMQFITGGRVLHVHLEDQGAVESHHVADAGESAQTPCCAHQHTSASTVKNESTPLDRDELNCPPSDIVHASCIAAVVHVTPAAFVELLDVVPGTAHLEGLHALVFTWKAGETPSHPRCLYQPPPLVSPPYLTLQRILI